MQAPSPEPIDFSFADLTPRERYKLLIGTVVPRPIALVTTVDLAGVANAAPFSFFNCLSADPALVALGVEFRADGRNKDTGRNVRDSRCFTVNIVSDAILEGMNVTAVPFDAGVDEIAEAGWTARPGTAVACPWIEEAPAALECRLHSILEIGTSREIILGEVVHAHYRAGIVDPTNFHVDPRALDAVGRMGGHGYASTQAYFDLPTMSVADYRDGRHPGRTTLSGQPMRRLSRARRPSPLRGR